MGNIILFNRKGDYKYMRNYRTNVKDYLNEDTLNEFEVEIDGDFGYVPFEETEANFCYLESINSILDAWIITVRVENEFTGEKYTKEYSVNKGSKLELNTFGVLFMCFLPPEKIPVLVEVVSVGLKTITLKTVGILEEYAADQDKKVSNQ